MKYLGIKKISLTAIFLFFLICTASKGEDLINVLFISSFEKTIPASISFEKSLSKAVKSHSKRGNIFFEYMTSQNLDSKSYYFYRDYLKAKYSDIKFDYIICWGVNSIELLTSNRDIFPNSKRILLEGPKKFFNEKLLVESDLRIVPDYSATIKEILRIKKLKKMIVIGTSDKLGQVRLDVLKETISNLKETIEVEYLLDKNIYEVSEKLKNPSDSTIAFYLLMFSDGFGKKMTPYQISEIICRESGIPVFSFWESLLGSGIVGGDLISIKIMGEELGKFIFSGDKKNYKKISTVNTIYDYKSLKKWKINRDKIRTSAIIVNRPPSFFIKYRIHMFIGIIIFLIYRQFLMKKLNKRSLELYEESHKKNVQLNIISELDPLTGLKNRRAMDKAIENELNRNSRHGTPLSILLIDIDHFKKVNDTYGHNIGDRVLSDISKLLKENIRSIDSASRWGGEEFLILASNTSLQEAMKFGEKIRKRIEKFDFTKIEKVTVSIGIAEYKSGETFNELYEKVDKALYSAKNKGRNRIEFKNL